MSKKVRAAFPHGIKVVSENGMRLLVDVEVRELAEVSYLRGWAYPNKDMVYSLKTVQEVEGGWKVVSEGVKYLFTPLEPETAKQIKSQMEFA
jgi:hypothetical protein